MSSTASVRGRETAKPTPSCLQPDSEHSGGRYDHTAGSGRRGGGWSRHHILLGGWVVAGPLNGHADATGYLPLLIATGFTALFCAMYGLVPQVCRFGTCSRLRRRIACCPLYGCAYCMKHPSARPAYVRVGRGRVRTKPACPRYIWYHAGCCGARATPTRASCPGAGSWWPLGRRSPPSSARCVTDPSEALAAVSPPAGPPLGWAASPKAWWPPLAALRVPAVDWLAGGVHGAVAGAVKFCSTCEIYRPAGAHHCAVCTQPRFG
jgi:hypothetical protein